MAVVLCSSCNTKLEVPEDHLGKKVRCATCSTVFLADLPGTPGHETPSQGPTSQEQVHGGDHADEDNDDDDYENDRRHMRRDLVPHRGGLILGMGITSIVVGILGFCCYGLPAILGTILGVVTFFLGRADMREIEKGNMDPDGKGTTQAGYICGIIGAILGILIFIGYVVFMAFFISMMLSQNTS